MTDSVTVAEATRLTGYSESKVRRLAKEGKLAPMTGESPLRLKRAAVLGERARVLERLGAVEPTATSSSSSNLSDRERLLSGALADLTAAHSALLDTFRRLTTDAVPNN